MSLSPLPKKGKIQEIFSQKVSKVVLGFQKFLQQNNCYLSATA